MSRRIGNVPDPQIAKPKEDLPQVHDPIEFRRGSPRAYLLIWGYIIPKLAVRHTRIFHQANNGCGIRQNQFPVM